MSPQDFKDMRRELGLSARQMSQALGFALSDKGRHIRRLESGEYKPSTQTLKVIAYIKEYGVLPDP